MTDDPAAPAPQPSAKPRAKPPREVDYADVDDVIGLAAEMQDLDRDRLSVEDLESVAAEVDIPANYVRPAVEELRRRRAALLEAEAKKLRRRRTIWLTAAGVALALVVWAVAGQASLSGKRADVEAQAAQVRNVLDYRARVLATWERAPESRERTAAMAGADTRVNRERQRYDEAVRAYNAAAGAFPGSLWAGLFGLPAALDTSDRVAW